LVANRSAHKFDALLIATASDEQIAAALQEALSPAFVLVRDHANPDIVLTAVLTAHPGEGLNAFHPTPVVAVINSPDVDHIVELLDHGVSDFVIYPFRREDVLARALRLVNRSRSFDTAQRLTEKLAKSHMIGESDSLKALVKSLPNVARCDAAVLISGETGTGKELCARSLHYLSPRTNMPFVPVNCGAIPVELVENEFFGHERGAYTNAWTSEHGLIYESDGGTLFLDEIDCLPLQAQVKLLRFLQEKEYRPVGSRKRRYADVRVIAALNVEPEVAVESGKLRKDLYYRLNVIEFRLPPLRERREDIPELVVHFIEKYSAEFKKKCDGVSSEALSSLILYAWPGNIRELEHVIQRALVLSEHNLIGRTDLLIPQSTETVPQSFSATKAVVIENFERAYILKLLRLYNGNITRAAEAAHKHRRAFWQLIRKHQIDARNFKR
jgi:DNA-binding NtrC family response regulator